MSTIDRAPATPLTRRQLRELAPEQFWGDDYARASERSDQSTPPPESTQPEIGQPEIEQPEIEQPEVIETAGPPASVPPAQLVIDPLDPFAVWNVPAESGSTPTASSPTPPDGAHRGLPADGRSTNTAAIWWYVALPVLQALAFVGVAIALLLLAFPDPTVPFTIAAAFDPTILPIVAGAAAGVVLLGLSAAIRLLLADRRVLRARGFERTASPWWHLLGPIGFLIARTLALRKQHPRAAVPLTVFVGGYLLIGVVSGPAATLLSLL